MHYCIVRAKDTLTSHAGFNTTAAQRENFFSVLVGNMFPVKIPFFAIQSRVPKNNYVILLYYCCSLRVNIFHTLQRLNVTLIWLTF